MMKIYSPLRLVLLTGSNVNSVGRSECCLITSLFLPNQGTGSIHAARALILQDLTKTPSTHTCSLQARQQIAVRAELTVGFITWGESSFCPMKPESWLWHGFRIEASYMLLTVRSKKGFIHKNRTLMDFICFQAKGLMHNNSC